MDQKPSDFPEKGDGSGPDGGEHRKDEPRFYPKGSKNKGPFIQKDKKPHGGGDQWKIFDKKGKRQGTINDKGEKIRD